MNQPTSVPTCPGCHFACSVDAYRCGRGRSFHEIWIDGKDVPERGIPPMLRNGKGASGEGAPPVRVRVMHGLNIMANKLQDRHAESAGRKVIATLARQGGFFSIAMLDKRTLVDADKLTVAIDELEREGLAEYQTDPIAGPVLRLTDAGKERSAEWENERREATAEFLAPLSEDELEQLACMLFKLIQGSKPPRDEPTSA